MHLQYIAGVRTGKILLFPCLFNKESYCFADNSTFTKSINKQTNATTDDVNIVHISNCQWHQFTAKLIISLGPIN
jgi:hypothetical protein